MDKDLIFEEVHEIQEGKEYYRDINAAEIRRSSDNKRTVAIINSDAVDTYNSIIDPVGLDLSQYQRNPVVLINHDKNLLAANNARVRMQDSKIILEVNDEDWDHDDPAIVRWFNKLKKGILKGTSIGFVPKKVIMDKDKNGNPLYRVAESVLFEVSFTSINSNPDAIVQVRAPQSNIDLTEVINNLNSLNTLIKEFDNKISTTEQQVRAIDTHVGELYEALHSMQGTLVRAVEATTNAPNLETRNDEYKFDADEAVSRLIPSLEKMINKKLGRE